MSEFNGNPPTFKAVVNSDPEWDLQRLQFAVIQDDSLIVDESPLVPLVPANVGDSVQWDGMGHHSAGEWLLHLGGAGHRRV